MCIYMHVCMCVVRACEYGVKGLKHTVFFSHFLTEAGSLTEPRVQLC